MAKETIGRLRIRRAVLKIVLVGHDRASEVFVEKKRRIAESLGVDFELKKYEENVSEAEIIDQINNWQGSHSKIGIVIQLPLPKHLNRDRLIQAIKPENDVDGMLYCLCAGKYQISNIKYQKDKLKIPIKESVPTSRESGPTPEVFPDENNLTIQQFNNVFIPPVVLAIDRAISESKIDLKAKKIVIVGRGFLVGQPLLAYLSAKYPESDIIATGKDDQALMENIKQADVVIGAAGASGIIAPEMIKPGTVLIDAGSAEENGALKGNILPGSYQKSSFYTPVPGGIGPLTIAYLFENLSNGCDL